ncbi:MAG: LysR family transcriptional regulator [Rheinheimera sp.]|nr:LysR family transcriptional regulator [Rheinheimera sp.]
MQSLNTFSLQYLQAFVLSAELGSISAAARVLGKRQSQLSGWIADLEAELNLELFTRTGNSLQLSPDGHTLLPLAQHTVAQSNRLQAAAHALQQHKQLVLVIGVAPHIPQQLLTDAIVGFMQQQPQVQVRIITQNEEELAQGLVERVFDVVLLHESIELHNSSYDYCRVGYYDEVFTVRSNHPLAGKPSIGVVDLAPFRELIWAEDYQQSADESGYSGYSSQIADFSTLKGVLLKTDCVALLPALMVASGIQAGQLALLQVNTELSTMRRRLELRWPLGSQHKTIISSWLRLVCQTLNNLDSDTPPDR